jgi:hypothetical protein
MKKIELIMNYTANDYKENTEKRPTSLFVSGKGYKSFLMK